MKKMRFLYGKYAHLLLELVNDDVAIATVCGVISISVLISMRADAIQETGTRCVVSDMSRCVSTITDDELGAIFDMARAGVSRDRSCAWVVSKAGGGSWRMLAARMACLGHARRVFNALPAAISWAQKEAQLPDW